MTPSDATDPTTVPAATFEPIAGGPCAGAEAVALGQAAAFAADEKQATAVAVLDVTAILSICEVFVICSARNPRLVGAVAQDIEDHIFVEFDRRPISVEGLDDRRWVLLDYGDTVIHVFLDEEREVYRLDRLYADAPVLTP